ncbi:transmembrane protein, putative (macronuclear) [Tetrahymena thermophila SB210]|uniref:Transmembrane protein, putative n=1 Tax=Tetrahymena thermophila (strain SB210) TaxID=312017 RepID=W7WWH2_TETTS|nr:transmembrane protein, putative [Tetrahymena thermophila SB210]EWS71180.1 transmembrane protein, putative [Tetrahymena thermophila SB210]|eukprot:XP_012656278.1 transmembrane protein, putative [Tetrahymena thermophila SB210]
MFIDKNKRLPAIFDGDLIYLRTADYLFQPFSISKRTLEYQLVNLGKIQTNFFLTSQITKEIFKIEFNNISAYSFDLQYLGKILSGFFITNYFYDDKQIYFCEFDFFYKFDLLTKQLFNLTTTSTSINAQPVEQIINYYRLDETKYYKKSENIIDSQNMIIIKTQQEDNIYIGQTQQGDSQIHFFQSQNDFYWHINLFNNPYRILNLNSQNQIFLAQEFDDGQNWIAVYDKSSNQITIYNSTDIFKIIDINFLLQSDISIYVLNWIQPQFIYVKNNSLYLFAAFSNTQVKQICILDSKIIQYRVCQQQNIIVTLTSQNIIYSINVKFLIKFQFLINFYLFYNRCQILVKFKQT